MHPLSVLKGWSRWVVIQQDFKLVGTSGVVQQSGGEILALPSELLKSQYRDIAFPRWFRNAFSKSASFPETFNFLNVAENNASNSARAQFPDSSEGNSPDSPRVPCRELQVERSARAWRRPTGRDRTLRAFCKLDKRSRSYPNRLPILPRLSYWIFVTYFVDITDALCPALLADGRSKNLCSASFVLIILGKQECRATRSITISIFQSLINNH